MNAMRQIADGMRKQIQEGVSIIEDMVVVSPTSCYKEWLMIDGYVWLGIKVDTND